ncbi:hypothetical protein CBR_g4824 [Chara braunii]|uniref:Sirohydrochlorin cobaltochelatase n=1 Tax=Chara braunii TaxID=69332 RepID=A0A388KIZ3_CHABU|nr:hypothetical protein CBR_g4824 [Chara braunii]|eukprot:GBG69997.1 hypothetical protein CBR_g4824 [Chara braunii]
MRVVSGGALHPGTQVLCPNTIRCNGSTCSCLSSLSFVSNSRCLLAKPILKSGIGRVTRGKTSLARTLTWDTPASLSSPAVGSSLCATYPDSFFSGHSIVLTAWKSVGTPLGAVARRSVATPLGAVAGKSVGADKSVYSSVVAQHHGPHDLGFSTDKRKVYQRPGVLQRPSMCPVIMRAVCSHRPVAEDKESTGSPAEKDEGEGRHAEGKQEEQAGDGLTGNGSTFVDVSGNASSQGSMGELRSQRPVPEDQERTGSSPGKEEREGRHGERTQGEQEGDELTGNGSFVVDVSKNASSSSSSSSSGLPESKEVVGIIIVDHGSRRRESNEMLDAFVKIFQAHTGRGIVEGAHMELAEPSIAMAFDRCVQRGANLVVVSPYFLSPGRHWFKDIPSLVASAAAKHPRVRYLIAAPIGLHTLVAEVVDSRIDYCLRHVAGEGPACEMCAGTGFCTMRVNGSSVLQPLPLNTS